MSAHPQRGHSRRVESQAPLARADAAQPSPQARAVPAGDHELVAVARRRAPVQAPQRSLAREIDDARGGGVPLRGQPRAELEHGLGADLAAVRLHRGARADALASALDATAFTTGTDVFLHRSAPHPATAAGRRLIAHEVTHVLQQAAGPVDGRLGPGGLRVSDPGDRHERAAARAAEHLTTGTEVDLDAPALRRGPSAAIQRQDAPGGLDLLQDWANRAKALHEAVMARGMFWSRPDTKRIFELLREARTVSHGTESLEFAYVDEFGSLLQDDLGDKLAEGDLALALALLGKTSDQRPPGGSSAMYMADASRIADALDGFLGADASAAMAVLVPYQGDFGRIGQLKEAYASFTHGARPDALENDLTAKLQGDELRQALDLLHGPAQVPIGMPSLLLAEAERETAPGSPCSVASVLRYLRAYLDYWNLGGQLLATEQLRARDPNSPEYADARASLAQDLDGLLGADGAWFLDGGPTFVAEPAFWAQLQRVLTNEHVFGRDKGRRLYLLWQISKYTADPGEGAPLAIVEAAGGTRAAVPGVEPTSKNIRPVLWDEVLRPGDVIQTWSTVESETTFACPKDRQFGKICGHSFLFVEYVYAESTSPPADAPRTWALIGGTGVPLTTGGEQDPARQRVTELEGLHLVGARIIDQRGYHFIARDPANNSSRVLPDEVRRAVWLESSEVWYAGRS